MGDSADAVGGDSYLLARDVWGPTRRSYWVVDQRFAAGAYPSSSDWVVGNPVPEVVEQLLTAGVETFVNLCQDDRTTHPSGTDLHLARYHESVRGRAEVLVHPIPDMGLPDGGPDEMVEILNALDEALNAGRTSYVHCWGGSGRTGTVVGCWLRRHGLAGPDEVLEVLRNLRMAGDRDGGHQDTPQTGDQRWMVETWEEGT